MDPYTTLGGSDRAFPETSWGTILAARDEAERRARLAVLIERYWKPAYATIRSTWTKTNDEAKDLTQEFFASLLEREFLADLDPARGRFRDYLKACLQNFLLDRNRRDRALKRGGGRQILSIEDHDLPIAGPGPGPGDDFDRAWARCLIDAAIADLETHLRAAGRERAFEIFKRADIAASDRRPSYDELAAELGLDHRTIKSEVQYARNLFRRLVRDHVAGSCRDPGAADDEYRTLFG